MDQKDMTLDVQEEGLMKLNDQSLPSIIIKMILLKKVLGTELFNISLKNPGILPGVNLQAGTKNLVMFTCLIEMILVTIGYLHTMTLYIIGHHTDLVRVQQEKVV